MLVPFADQNTPRVPKTEHLPGGVAMHIARQFGPHAERCFWWTIFPCAWQSIKVGLAHRRLQARAHSLQQLLWPPAIRSLCVGFPQSSTWLTSRRAISAPTAFRGAPSHGRRLPAAMKLTVTLVLLTSLPCVMAFLGPGRRPVPPTFLAPATSAEHAALARPLLDLPSMMTNAYRLAEAERRAAAHGSRARPLLMPGGAVLSFLETISIKKTTLKGYHTQLATLVNWCRLHGKDWTTHEQLDELLVEHFDEQFWRGLPVIFGSRLLAAMKFFVPEVSRLGRL